MKNFSTFITRKSLNKMIEAHKMGLNLGYGIDADVLEELNEIHLGRDGKYLSNLNLSEKTEKFLDNFISDFKSYEKTGEGSNFARNYIDSLK